MNELGERALRRQYAHVFRFVRRRARDADLAEDVAQEVFADAAERLPADEAANPASLPWLYTVARRRFADEVRRRRREPPVVPLALARDTPAEYGPGVAQVLADAMARLPGGQREVLVLKLIRGLRFAEIAERLGLTEEACRMRFMRALRSLRDDLEREGIEP